MIPAWQYWTMFVFNGFLFIACLYANYRWNRSITENFELSKRAYEAEAKLEALQSLVENGKLTVGVDMAKGKDQTVTAWYRFNGDTAELCHISPSGIEEREKK